MKFVCSCSSQTRDDDRVNMDIAGMSTYSTRPLIQRPLNQILFLLGEIACRKWEFRADGTLTSVFSTRHVQRSLEELEDAIPSAPTHAPPRTLCCRSPPAVSRHCRTSHRPCHNDHRSHGSQVRLSHPRTPEASPSLCAFLITKMPTCWVTGT